MGELNTPSAERGQGARSTGYVTPRVVMFSGGIGSYASALRVTERYPHAPVELLFTDVGGDHATEHLGEDRDTYRFLDAAALDLGVPLTVLNDGRTIYDVFREKRWLGNASLAHCSWELKTKPAREWVEQHYPDPASVVLVVGIDWTEIHRLTKVVEAWKPYSVEAPMTEKPYLAKPQMVPLARERGLEPPRMYAEGFAHANCVGCVKAGQAHWERVLRQRPDTFAFHEQAEQDMRSFLGADVAILRDRANGGSVPLTLSEFRGRVESGWDQLDMFDEGGCGCFLEAS